MKFLRWLKSKYPGEKIGLIWDRAAAHISSEVLDCAKELGIIVELLYAGMTYAALWYLAEQSYQNDCTMRTRTHWSSKRGRKYKFHESRSSVGLSKQCTKSMPVKGELEKLLKFFMNVALTHMTPKRLSLVPTSNHYQKTPYTTYSLIQHQKETNFAELYE